MNFESSRLLSLVPALGLALACSGEPPGAEEDTAQVESALVTVTENRSLAVTEVDLLSQFSFEEILSQLLSTAAVAGQTPLQLFRSWVATNNLCSETIGGQTVPDSFNGFPFSCRPGEEARDQEPFSGAGAYVVTGLFNRFDLAPANGADCGEYRIVVSRTEVDPVTRKSLIFEAKLPNPQPALGLEGCRPVAQFWGNLSSVISNAERATQLHDFYFNGLPGFAPVVHINHFQRLTGSGRVRTNSFLGGGPWSLREYGLRRVCNPTCSLVFIEQPTGDNPFWALSGSPTGHPLAGAFQDWFISSLQPGSGLLVNDVNRLLMNTPDTFLMGESQLPENIGAPTPPPRNLADELSPEFSSRIQTRLTALGLGLTPAQLINRADSTTCTGCHRSASGDDVGFGAPFPDALPFRQTEKFTTSGPDGARYRVSTALSSVFLPFRKANLEAFLNQPPPNQPPQVSVTSPTNGALFTAPASVVISADATDSDGTVARVEFYQGTTLLGTRTAPPFSVTWSSVAQGAYALTARAFDNSGANATSSTVDIIVNPANSTPCAALCSNPTVFSGPNYQSGNLGTGAVCRETTATLHGGNCSNLSSRTLKVNGSTMNCSGWALPPKRGGGYCIQVTAGAPEWASFATW
jgi:hypothetical protein